MLPTTASHNGGSSPRFSKLLVFAVMFNIVFSFCGLLFAIQKFGEAKEASFVSAAQTKHTEQKVTILENELHKFRAEFRQTVNKLNGAASVSDDLEAIMKRLDQVRVCMEA